MDPLSILKDKIDEIKHDVQLQVQIALLREFAKLALSRLATLDADRAASYSAAIREIGD